MPSLSAIPAGNLAFSLKMKSEAPVTPAAPVAPAAIAKPVTPVAVPPVASASEKEASNKDASSKDASQQENAGGKGISEDQTAGGKTTGPTDTTGPTPVFAAPQAPVIHQDAPKVAAAAPVHAATAIEPKPAVSNPQQISLHVASGKDDDRTVEVRLTERGGEIRVAVRTPDETLAKAMREDLGSLTGKLTQSGFATESITPTHTASSNLSDQRGEPSNQNGDGGRRQSSEQQNNSGEQQQEQEDRSKRASWMEELDHSLNNRSNVWQPYR
jgi:hypothetical protein